MKYIILFLSPFLFSCDPGIKQLGTNEKTTPFTPPSTPSETSLELSYAVRKNSRATQISMSGTTYSRKSITNTCGLQGNQCRCDFFTNREADPIGSSDVNYYSPEGGFLLCSLPEGTAPSSITHAQLAAKEEAVTSPIVPLVNGEDNLSLEQVVGKLPLINVRKIYRYRCFLNYLKKEGISARSLPCAGNPSELNILQFSYTYYLFSGNDEHNLEVRRPDLFEYQGCFSYIKSIDCTTEKDGESGPDSPNALRLAFGIYNRRADSFTEVLHLISAPPSMGGNTSSYGFAVKPDANKLCPPGMEYKKRFVQTPKETEDSNVNYVLEDQRLEPLGFSTKFATRTYSSTRTGARASCDRSGNCTIPDLDYTQGRETNSASYDVKEEEEYCVIKATIFDEN